MAPTSSACLMNSTPTAGNVLLGFPSPPPASLKARHRAQRQRSRRRCFKPHHEAFSANRFIDFVADIGTSASGSSKGMKHWPAARATSATSPKATPMASSSSAASSSSSSMKRTGCQTDALIDPDRNLPRILRHAPPQRHPPAPATSLPSATAPQSPRAAGWSLLDTDNAATTTLPSGEQYVT